MVADQPAHTPEKDEPRSEHLDGVLQLLVLTVTGNDGRVPVVLTVGGYLIGGDIVSGHKFFEPIAETYKKALDQAPEKAREYIKAEIADYEFLASTYKKDRTDDDPLPIYIHLANARIFHPGAPPVPPSKDGFSWRGKISAVSGFSIGTASWSGDEPVDK